MEELIRSTTDLVIRNADKYADEPFCLFYEDTISWKDLEEKTAIFAAWLAEQGVQQGDVVSFMMGNSPEFFFVLLGAQRLGAVAGPVSCWWQAEEVSYLLSDCRPKVLVLDPDHAGIASALKGRMPSVKKVVLNLPAPLDLDFPHEALGEILTKSPPAPGSHPGPGPEDTASLMYTSGTTGQPKGVMLSHKGIIQGARIKTLHIPIERGERILCVLPLFHSGGLNDLAFPTMYRGGAIVLRRNFSATEFWQCVESYRVNGFYIVPTMWNILLRVPEADTVDVSSLRLGVSGAAPIPPEQLDECERRFNVPILEAYGATENSGGITANSAEKRKYGSIGTAFEGLDLKIVDEQGRALGPGKAGEIAVAGDTVMQGYWNKPEATAETIREGYLYTGDVGCLDSEGFLFIVDRKKDMIIRGGVNVYPKEIENIIKNHPKVDNVAVIPEPDDKYGQVAKACVVLKRGDTAGEEEIIAYAREHLAAYKVPARVLFRESLPQNAVGKVIKKDLLAELEEERTAEPVPVAHFFTDMPERFIPEKARGVDASVSYNITGGGGGKWTATIRDGRLTLTEEVLRSPTVYLVARDRDYHDIVTGKLDGITAVMTGKLKIEGDVNFMASFREMMRPIKFD